MNQVVSVGVTALVILVSASLAADMTFTCPETWQVDETARPPVFLPVQLTCTILQSSLDKCTRMRSYQTSFKRVNSKGKEFDVCVVNATGKDSCGGYQPLGTGGGERGLNAPNTSCGCQQNDTHHVFVAKLINFPSPPHVLIDGNFYCERDCLDFQLRNPMSVDIAKGCYNVGACNKVCPNGKLDAIGCKCVCDPSVKVHQCKSAVMMKQVSVPIGGAAVHQSSPAVWLLVAVLPPLVLIASAPDGSSPSRR